MGKWVRTNNRKTCCESACKRARRDFGNEHELTLRAANCLGLAQLNAADWKSACDTFEKSIDILTNIHQDQPNDARNTLMLGADYCNLGNAQSQLNVDAIENYTAAIELLGSLAEQQGGRNQFLKNAYQGRAGSAPPGRTFRRIAGGLRRALDLAAGEPTKSRLQLKRLKTRAQQGDYGQAVQQTDTIFTELANDQLAYDAAGVFAIAVQMVELDESLTAEEREQKMKTYRDRAFELLEVAKGANQFNSG